MNTSHVPSILDGIEMPPGVRDVQQVRNRVALELHVVALMDQTPDDVRVCDTSEIREERIFSREDVTRLIVFLAMTRGLRPADLKVVKMISHPEGGVGCFGS
ncbi:hypothetical protein COY07_01815 [Candidatus Peregrinibacteria bacterium CG_4_10_14_0_2_um_filter_43_11]|nr:MAG: hypothetical protein COY07_01815 [Candidatus Peregrinibacteria bacterium CG_4_10_14_0_2_um_filter_43_11]